MNSLFLLCLTIIPFPTGLQATYHVNALARLIFVGTHFLCGISLLVLWIYATHRHRLVRADVSLEVILSISWRIALAPALALLATAMSFADLAVARAIFLLIPVLYLSHPLADRGWQTTAEAKEEQDSTAKADDDETHDSAAASSPD